MGGIMGGFYRISEWIMRFSVTNLLWVLFNIPVLFLASGLLGAETLEQVHFVFILIAIVAPFVLFPATTALYSVVRKWVMGDTDVPLIKTFWRGYKDNYKQSMFGGLIIVPLWVIYYIDFIFYAVEISSMLRYLFIVLGVILLAFTFNFFSMTVHFHMKFWALLKNSALISIGKPLVSVGIVIVNGVIMYISFTQFTFLLPFFTASLSAYFSFLGFYHIYNKAQQLREKEEEKKRLEEEEQAEAGEQNEELPQPAEEEKEHSSLDSGDLQADDDNKNNR